LYNNTGPTRITIPKPTSNIMINCTTMQYGYVCHNISTVLAISTYGYVCHLLPFQTNHLSVLRRKMTVLV